MKVPEVSSAWTSEERLSLIADLATLAANSLLDRPWIAEQRNVREKPLLAVEVMAHQNSALETIHLVAKSTARFLEDNRKQIMRPFSRRGGTS